MPFSEAGQTFNQAFSEQADPQPKVIASDQFVDIVLRAARPASNISAAMPEERVAVMKTIMPLETKLPGGDKTLYTGGTVEQFFFANERSLRNMADLTGGADKQAYLSAIEALNNPAVANLGRALTPVHTIEDYLRAKDDPGVTAKPVMALA